MNDKQKTLTFVLVGAVALIIGIAPWKSTATGPSPIEQAGTKLFEDFENPLAADSLEIIEYDEDTSTIRRFKVAQVNGVWSIPSHQNYPADAKEHLAAAATALIDVKKLSVAGESPGEHELFGVIDPDASKLEAGTTGVGERIIMKDGKGTTLADLIVGKEDKDQPGIRFVRITDEDPVYRVKLSTDKFSTKFEDWIEKDLLKLNTLDIREIALNDYKLEQGINRQGQLAIGQVKASEMKLSYDDSKSTWKLDEFVEYEDNKPKSSELAEDEELNTEKLNELRNALDDLKIVDVNRKPKGLRGDLSIDEEVAKDSAAIDELAESLLRRGFVPAAIEEGKLSLLSTDGEVICRLKDGVSYVVRFGRARASDNSGEQKSGLDRYVMITAQLDKSMIPEPELEPLPGEEATEESADASQDEANDEGDAKPDEKEDAAKPDDKKEAADADQDKDAKPEDADKSAAEKSEAAAEKAKLEEKRAQVEKANQRKLDDYNEKLKKAQEKVDELNARFADWYYVISDDVYKKVHLTRADVVKKKETKAGEGDSVGDFKALDKDLDAPDAESK